jgi:DNA-binding transcriptional regulator WhiA
MEIELIHEKLDSLKNCEIANLYRVIQAQAETIARIEQLLADLANNR